MPDFFKRSEAQAFAHAQEWKALYSEHTGYDETITAIQDASTALGESGKNFRAAKQRYKAEDDRDRAILADVSKGPVPIGYVSKALIYGGSRDQPWPTYASAHDRRAVWRLVKGGALMVWLNGQGGPQKGYWLVRTTDVPV